MQNAKCKMRMQTPIAFCIYHSAFRGSVMHDLTSSKVIHGVHCLNLRHKGMYTTSAPDPDALKFYDAYDAAAYWCVETASAFGPDGKPARPRRCARDGLFCRPAPPAVTPVEVSSSPCSL